MGRVLIAMLFATLFLLPLGASGSSEAGAPTKGPTEVSFWSLFTGGDGEFFDAMVKEFNATHSNIVMKTDTVKFDNYYTKLTTALAAKQAPDVVVIHQANLLNYVPKGSLYALDSLLAQMNAPLSDFVAAPINGCKFDGKLYALPLDVHPLIMYYNTDLFEKAGITSIPVSYADLINDAQQVQQKTGAVGIACDNTTATYKAYTLTRLFYSMLEQQGTSLLSADLKSANFNNAAGKAALEALIGMVHTSKVTPEGLDYDGSVTAFKLGKAAIHFNGVWATGAFESQAGLKFAAVPLPALLGKPAAWAGSHTLAIPVQKQTDGKRLEAAATFILWMTEHGEMWAKAGHIPTRISVTQKEAFTELPYRKGYAEAAAFVVAPPRTAAWEEIYSTLSDMLEAAVAKNADSAVALSDMERKVNSIIASY